MNGEKRIAFTFDEENLQRLDTIMESEHYSTMGDAVGEAIATLYGLKLQAGEGFTEVIVRNPRTGQERVMRIPRPLATRVLEKLRSAGIS